MVYGTGYKSGGFSSSGSYAPETLNGIEIGTKSLWNAQRVQINASVFDYDSACPVRGRAGGHQNRQRGPHAYLWMPISTRWSIRLAC